MRIFVTGANGFVGNILVKRLEESGFDTWAVVRKKTSRLKEITIDFSSCSEDEIFEKFSGASCVVHLAANADFSRDFDEKIYNVNCLANIAIANVFKHLNVHLIFASNALIAGMHEPFIDAKSNDKPEIPYNIAKYISEEYIMKHIKDYCIMRIGGIYGYKGPEHLFLNRAINYTLNSNQLLSIQNNGLGRRNYIYVEDLCTWFLHIIQHRIKGKYLIAGKETLYLKGIFQHMNHVFLGNKGKLRINEMQQSTDQIIEIVPPNIIMHDYQSAFNDIKNKYTLT